MDKYTVDLDQVLNDFEYSELTTDSYAGNTTYQHAPGSSNYASSSKSKTADVKHSITNVFHSLNEYLNSDISSSTPKVHLLDTKENYFIPNDNNNTTFLQSNSKQVNTTEDIGDNEVCVDSDEVENEVGQDSGTKNDETDRVTALLDLKLVEDGENVTEKNGCNNIENLLDLENDIVNNIDVPLNVDDILISNKDDVSNAPSKDSLDQNEGANVINVEVSSERVQAEPLQSVTQDYQDETCRDNLVENAVEVEVQAVKEEPPKLNMKEVVSFEDGLDIDDAALNQYLDELEEEYQEAAEEVVEEKEIVEAKSVVAEAEIVRTPLEVVSVKTEETEPKKNVVPVPVVEEMEEVSVKESVDVSESVTVDEVPKDIEISEETDQKDTESVSSMERPKMLELPVSTVDEVPKREINLIGKVAKLVLRKNKIIRYKNKMSFTYSK